MYQRPVDLYLLMHIFIVAATKACSHKHQEVPLFFRPNVRMGKKCDRSDFDCGMIVGARQGGFSVPETAALLGFSLGFAENGAKKQKIQ